MATSSIARQGVASPLVTQRKEPFAPINVNMRRSRSAAIRGGDKYDLHPPRREGPSPRRSGSTTRVAVDARAKSSARVRSSPPTIRAQHQRPRPISTGRITRPPPPPPPPPAEDPQSVTRAILDLRDKREQSQSRRQNLKQHALWRSQTQVETADGAKSPRSSSQSLSRSNSVASARSLSKGEQKASFKLKEAEDRIGSLMQELEELRFFHEIDMEPAAAAAPAVNKSVAGVPSRGNKDPPKMNMLTPRRLANLDRTTLELEAQELQRQVEVLYHEKTTLQAKVQIGEQQSKSHSEDVGRIHKLEKALSDLRSTLGEQMQTLHHGRAQLTEEYEAKLKSEQDQVENVQTEADNLATELESLTNKYDSLDNEYGHFRQQTKEQLQQLQSKWASQEEALSHQLEENNRQMTSMQESLEDRDNDIVRLQKTFTERNLAHDAERRQTMESNGDVQRELALKILKRDEDCKQLEAVHKEKDEELSLKDARIDELEQATFAQADQLESLQKQLSEVEGRHEERIEDLKRTSDAREQRRLDDLVQSQHSKNMEYEERLVDTRKQLTLATDRHQTDIEQKEIELAERLEKAVNDSKHSVRSEYEPQLAALREEVESVQQKYDSAMDETFKHQVRLESKDRDVAREWERRDALRSGEMERINNKLDRTMRDLAEKESKLKSLTERLEESEERCQALLSDLEAQQSEEIKSRDEVMSQRKAMTRLRTDLARKDYDVAEIKNDFESKIEELQTQLDLAMKTREESTRKDRALGDENKSKLSTLQHTLEKTRSALVTEQARHESLEAELRVEIAKLEGKLAATESTLKQKRSVIEDLEIKLMSADEMSSSTGTKLQSTIVTLRRDLLAAKHLLDEEQRLSQERGNEVSQLTRKLEIATQSDSVKLAGLEQSLVSTQVKLEDVERAKESAEIQLEEMKIIKANALEKVQELEQANMECEVEINRLQEKQEEALVNLRSVSTDKEEVSGEIKKMEQYLEERVAAHEKNVSELQMDFEEKEKEAVGLRSEVVDLKQKLEEREKECDEFGNRVLQIQGSLDEAIEVSVNNSHGSEKQQQRIKELELMLETAKESNDVASSSSHHEVHQLHQDLREKEMAEIEISRQLRAVMNERAEAIDALEQMIEEVQVRQEDFDQLADILDTREEELENAKLIATKALASAQEIKNRYKEKGNRESSKQEDLHLRIDELNASVEYLTDKGDKLKKKTMRLEAELHHKNKECAKLRDDVREAETKSTQSSSFDSAERKGFTSLTEGQAEDREGKMDAFLNRGIDPNDEPMKNFELMETNFSVGGNEVGSGGSAASGSRSGGSGGSSLSDPLGDSMLTTATDFGISTKWLADFEDGKSIFSSDNSSGDDSTTQTDSTPKKGQRTAERDALRKYVRRRYLKRKNTKATI